MISRYTDSGNRNATNTVSACYGSGVNSGDMEVHTI